MRIIHTDKDNLDALQPQQKEWVYNGLDATVTAEVLEVLLPQLDPFTEGTYQFSRDLQGPVLEMRLRGVLVDLARRDEIIERWYDLLSRLEDQLERIVGEGLDFHGFKWSSPRDCNHLFYEVLGIQPIRRRGSATADRSALEKLGNYFTASPVVRFLLVMRDLLKKIGTLRTEIDKDGRIRTSYNIAGTTTGRLSSSLSEFGTGTNLQNIEEGLRSIFIADPGYKLAYLDAEQGESRIVGAIEGNLFNDWRYLDACEGGDLHTDVARLVWPGLAWTGNQAMDRKLAEKKYYRDHTRRVMCKKLGHGTNYGGKPQTMGDQTRIERALVEDFQDKYFRAFPAHQRWHQNVRERLAKEGYLISLTGRKRYFFGRRYDDATLREAIAYDPQGSLADILNRGMLNVWRRKDCQLLMQIHDAVLVQYPEGREREAIPKIVKALEYPIRLESGRNFAIPYGVATGWNWGKHSEDNPDGLKEWEGSDSRRRTPKVSFMDQIIRPAHRKSRYARGV